MKESQGSAWWSDAGPDQCEFCFVAHYAETGYYCAGCDRSVCATCGVTVIERRVVVCPECGVA